MTPDPATHFRRDPDRVPEDRDRNWRSNPRGELAAPIRPSDRALPSFHQDDDRPVNRAVRAQQRGTTS